MKIKIIFSILALALPIIFSVTPIVQNLEYRTLDYFGYGHTPDSSIVILAIDNKSIADIGAYPWDRSEYAQITNRLNKDGARAVGYDINFFEPKTESGDAAFAASLAQSEIPVVL